VTYRKKLIEVALPRETIQQEDVARAIRSLNILGSLKAGPDLDLPVQKEALLDG
jgi:hypothetical protein